MAWMIASPATGLYSPRGRPQFRFSLRAGCPGCELDHTPWRRRPLWCAIAIRPGFVTKTTENDDENAPINDPRKSGSGRCARTCPADGSGTDDGRRGPQSPATSAPRGPGNAGLISRPVALASLGPRPLNSVADRFG